MTNIEAMRDTIGRWRVRAGALKEWAERVGQSEEMRVRWRAEAAVFEACATEADRWVAIFSAIIYLTDQSTTVIRYRVTGWQPDRGPLGV